MITNSSFNRIITKVKPGRIKVEVLARDVGIPNTTLYRLLSNCDYIEKVRNGVNTKFYKRR